MVQICKRKDALYSLTDDEFDTEVGGWLSGLDMWLLSGNGEFSSFFLLFDLSDALNPIKKKKLY